MVPVRVPAVHQRGPPGSRASNARGSQAVASQASFVQVSTSSSSMSACADCSDVVSQLTYTRQLSVLNAFLDALTRGGPNGLPRPIEIHAHDPTRYVGDMLAWVHQTTASEHEFLESLFGVKERRRMVGAERQRDDSDKLVAEALDKDLDGLSRPLKVSRLGVDLSVNLELRSDAHTADYKESRRGDHGVQNSQPPPILPCDHAEDYR